MKYLSFFCFFILVLFLGFQKVSAESETIVINEVMSNPVAGQVEWIELYNKTDFDIDLSDYTIEDGSTALPKSLDACTILAKEYLVLLKGSGVCKFGFSLNNEGDIIKLKKVDLEIDSVIYGSLAGNAPIAGQGESIARIPNSQDSDSDATDFKIQTVPTPGEKNPDALPNNPPTAPKLISPEEGTELIIGENIVFSWEASTDADGDEVSYDLFLGCSVDFLEDDLIVGGQIETGYEYTADKDCDEYFWQVEAFDGLDRNNSEIFSFKLKDLEPIVYSDKVFINEIMPDPAGDDATDEWIELFNNSNEPVNLENWVLEDTKGAIKKFIIKGVVIDPFSYMVFSRGQTNITLNNDNDGLRLYQPDGNLLDEESQYSAAKQDFSWARTVSGGWSWTIKSTPGRANAIESPVTDDEEDEPVINKVPIKIKTKNHKSYNNKLVQIEGEVVETSGRTFYLNDGSGKVKVYIQEQAEIVKPAMHKGDIFAIIGVVNFYRNAWRILPRIQEDIILIREKNQDQAQSSEKKPVVAKKVSATKPTSSNPEQARAPTVEPFIKTVKAATDQKQNNNSAKDPIWIQLAKMTTGLAIVFVVLLILKVKSMPRAKIIGGKFGRDDT